MSVSRHHADWLSLVESSGPFLSLPVLLRAFPQGLDPRDPEQAKQLRLAYEEWQENPNLAAKQRAWVMHVLTQVLLHPKELLAEGQTLPPGLMATMAEYGEILRPELALLGPIGSELAGKPQLLISLYPQEQSLDKPMAGKHWKATAGTRMMELLHATDVPLGLVTNGEEWMLVFAPRGDTTGFTSWYASLWIDEPITLRAFHSLLSTRRFFGVAPSDTLLALLKESAQDQQEVTNQLGDQVRDAVEVLIQAFDRLDQDSGRTLLKGLDEKSLYDAALTVMMRLVFLFSAEERGLLHLNEQLYDDNYAVSTLREQLQEVADRYGEEVLERRHDGWSRLLASFRAVHGGVNHQDFMLPAYGGSLFDPDRYPFLEGRAQGTRWQSSPAAPLEINNRVVLHLLKSLQMLQVKVPGGGPTEALRVSFEGLNIEQIGHVYEGLLDHTAVRAKEVVLGLAASRKKPVASITLAELEKLRQDDEAKLIELLEEGTGRSGKALEKALKNGGEPEDFHKLLVVCGQDKELAERIIPFRGLLRQDSFERMVVVLPGGIYVGQGSARRSTGTHYTPRSLTEPIVQHTLEPLVYHGPSEGRPKEQWRLRSPKEILDLKVCDMAMGSGAFLVQACRYLSERLVEAWENLEKEHPGEVLITPEGGFSQGEPSERLIPKEAAERLAIARRLVADRCLYGVDINPMAVEMAKLSIWLITVDKSRPFTFLDHALKCGDSLLGISHFKQLETFSLDEEHAKQVIILSNYDDLIRTAVAKRCELERLPSNDPIQIATKQALLHEAEERMEQLKLASDLLIAAELTDGNTQKKEMARAAAHMKVSQFALGPVADFRHFAHEQIEGQRSFHWPLEFPEVIQGGGFSAFVGNPPFKAGRFLRAEFGRDYLLYLQGPPFHLSGQADYCAAFASRAFSMCSLHGIIGLITTKTISEGDTRAAFLDTAFSLGGRLTWVSSLVWWPGTAQVVISLMVIERSRSRTAAILDGTVVPEIDSTFSPAQELRDAPHQLAASSRLVAKGVGLGSEKFILENEYGTELHQLDPLHVRRYIVGGTHNSAPDGWGGCFVFFFQECDSETDLQKLASGQAFIERIPLDERRGKYWRYRRSGERLFTILRESAFCVIRAQTSSTWTFSFWPREDVLDQTIIAFGTNCRGLLAVLNSSIHESWVGKYGSLMKTDTTYGPSEVFKNFPLPYDPVIEKNDELSTLAENLAKASRTAGDNEGGKTRAYLRLHDPEQNSSTTLELRKLHELVDHAVLEAYGWMGIDLGHGFYGTERGMRFTISESARRLILDRLLALNHQRYEEEISVGLREKKTKAGSAKPVSGKEKREKTAAQGELL